jgi:carbon monoxide dehydrogenase subunit G
MRFHTRKLSLVPLVFAGFVLSILNTAWAQESVEMQEGKFALGVGYAIARFDTNFKFKDKQSGISVFVDGEGTLGLPETDFVPILYGAYRFNKKHMMGFSYFRVKRESTLLDFDDTVDDITISGQVTLRDNTRFYNLFYGYSLYEDERSRVQGLIGINALDLKYVFEANGTISYPGGSTTASYETEEGIFAPLPLFGFNFWYAFTPKWSLDTKVTFVAGQYQETKAWVVNTAITSRYQFNRHVGGLLGIAYFDADVTVEDSEERTDVNYGYDGLFLGLHIVF